MNRSKRAVILRFLKAWLVFLAICLALVATPALLLAFVNWDASMINCTIDALMEGRVMRALVLFSALISIIFNLMFKN